MSVITPNALVFTDYQQNEYDRRDSYVPRGDRDDHDHERHRQLSPQHMGVASTSRHSPGMMTSHAPRQMTPEEKSDKIIRDAEASKARILPATGNDIPSFLHHTHSVLTDENFLVVGSHMDSGTVDKIQRGEYIDFGRLIPKDRIIAHDEQCLEMVIREGRMYYVPANEGTTISGFPKWEQAFRVFSNIYTKLHPNRSSELIEYNHIIHTIASTYTWDNVYMYDKDFRMHMAQNPRCNWSVILQQAWSLRLKDRLNNSNSHSGLAMSGNSGTSANGRINEPCKRFNRGYCSFGTSCKFEHKCSYCHKYGHTILTCRKLAADQEKANKNSRKRDSYSGGGGHHYHKSSSKEHHQQNSSCSPHSVNNRSH